MSMTIKSGIITQMTPESSKHLSNIFRGITNWLKSSNATYEVIDHPEIDGTAYGSSEISKTKPEQGAKALIMTVSGETPIMVVVRGPDRVNFKAIKKAVNSKDVRLASGEEIKKITPIEVGSLPPFGNFLGLTTYADRQLLEEEEIACGTGLTTKTIIMKPSDYKEIVKPIEGDFSKQE